MPYAQVARGDRVRAFNPRKFGVIDHGTVDGVGSKYVQVDFGRINGGRMRVPHDHIVEVVQPTTLKNWSTS